jgi:hypothetical protein
MFSFSEVVVISTISLGCGYNVAKPEQNNLLRLAFFVLLVLFAGTNHAQILIAGSSFLVGVLYALDVLENFESPLAYLENYRYQRLLKKTINKAEEHLKFEQEQRDRYQEQQRREQEARRAEEARQYREQSAREEQAKKQRDSNSKQEEAEAQKRREQAQREEQELKNREEARKQREREEARQKSQQQEKAAVDNRSPEEILGLKPGFTAEELKKAYQTESMRAHPDKWNSKPEHIKAMMQEEQKKINWAYSQLKKKFS